MTPKRIAEGELNTDLKLVDISIVPITDQNITDIAKHAGVTEKAVRQYLGDNRIKNGHIEKSCHWITGCYPARFRQGDEQAAETD